MQTLDRLPLILIQWLYSHKSAINYIKSYYNNWQIEHSKIKGNTSYLRYTKVELPEEALQSMN